MSVKDYCSDYNLYHISPKRRAELETVPITNKSVACGQMLVSLGFALKERLDEYFPEYVYPKWGEIGVTSFPSPSNEQATEWLHEAFCFVIPCLHEEEDTPMDYGIFLPFKVPGIPIDKALSDAQELLLLKAIQAKMDYCYKQFHIYMNATTELNSTN